MVLIFSLLLIFGIVSGQIFDLSAMRELVTFVTSLCLAYIMIEVGLEFSIGKRKLSSYGWDTIVSASAAIIPALLWFVYFFVFVKSSWQSALLAGLSSAPTSAGVLFSMMMAAGLSATWVFKKARVLAVLDDLVTILLLTPLQVILHGFEWESMVVLIFIGFFLFAAFRWQNSIPWPVGKFWLLLYAVGLASVISLVKKTTHIHLEVLIPAFMFGCLLNSPTHETPPQHPAASSLDTFIKGAFMFLVGLSLPKIALGSMALSTIVGQVFILTILANIGKMFPAFCYRKEATLRERLALGVAMFPRGEVGAGVLLIGLSYGLNGYENTLAVLSLALNLVLTGLFIEIVMQLLKRAENVYGKQ